MKSQTLMMLLRTVPSVGPSKLAGVSSCLGVTAAGGLEGLLGEPGEKGSTGNFTTPGLFGKDGGPVGESVRLACVKWDGKSLSLSEAILTSVH